MLQTGNFYCGLYFIYISVQQKVESGMTNSMINPQPNYSGVTIQIANPAVYAGANGYGICNPTRGGQIYPASQQYYMTSPENNPQAIQELHPQIAPQTTPAAYPPQYYLNNYNYQAGVPVGERKSENDGLQNLSTGTAEKSAVNPQEIQQALPVNSEGVSDVSEGAKQEDMTKSTDIINNLSEREAQIKAEKKNEEKSDIIPLTDEYIKSLENYLNNPDDEIRLMASKEILTRLDEDKRRYDDAALNALLNKMLQDPSKLVRIASLSAFSSRLASGNDYTVQLLQKIQVNPNADKEDVLQAADILLKMSAGKEVRNVSKTSSKTNTTKVQ